MSDSTYYRLIPNQMASEVSRMYFKDNYDTLDTYQDFKDKDDFIAKRKIWGNFSNKHQIILMLIANIQNRSKRVYGWQTVQNFDVIKVHKDTHMIIAEGNKFSHGRYKTILNILNKGENNYFIHIEDSRKEGDYIGKIKENLNMFISDYILEYDRNIKAAFSSSNESISL